MPDITFVGATTADTGVGVSETLTIPVPPGVVEDDLLLVSIAAVTDFDPPPAGWTLLQRIQAYVYPGGIFMDTYYRVAGSTEPADYTWTALGNIAVGHMAAYRYVDMAVALDNWSCGNGQQFGSYADDYTMPPIVAHTPGTMLVGIAAINQAVTWTPPSGMTERTDASLTVGGTFFSMTICDQLQGAAGLLPEAKTYTPTAAGAMALSHILLRAAGQPTDFASLTVVDEYEADQDLPLLIYFRRHRDTTYLFALAPYNDGTGKTKHQKINRLTDAIAVETLETLTFEGTPLVLERVATPGGLVADPAGVYWCDNGAYTDQARLRRDQTSDLTETAAVDFSSEFHTAHPVLEVGALGTWSAALLAALSDEDGYLYLYSIPDLTLVATVNVPFGGATPYAGPSSGTGLAVDGNGDFWVLGDGVLARVDATQDVVEVQDLSADLPVARLLGYVAADDSLILVESPERDFDSVPTQGRIGKYDIASSTLTTVVTYGKVLTNAQGTLQNGPLTVGGTLQYWLTAGQGGSGSDAVLGHLSMPEIFCLNALTLAITAWQSVDMAVYSRLRHAVVDTSPSPAKVWLIATANTEVTPDDTPDKLAYFTLAPEEGGSTYEGDDEMEAVASVATEAAVLMPEDALYEIVVDLTGDAMGVFGGVTDPLTLTADVLSAGGFYLVAVSELLGFQVVVGHPGGNIQPAPDSLVQVASLIAKATQALTAQAAVQTGSHLTARAAGFLSIVAGLVERPSLPISKESVYTCAAQLASTGLLTNRMAVEFVASLAVAQDSHAAMGAVSSFPATVAVAGRGSITLVAEDAIVAALGLTHRPGVVIASQAVLTCAAQLAHTGRMTYRAAVGFAVGLAVVQAGQLVIGVISETSTRLGLRSEGRSTIAVESAPLLVTPTQASVAKTVMQLVMTLNLTSDMTTGGLKVMAERISYQIRATIHERAQALFSLTMRLQTRARVEGQQQRGPMTTDGATEYVADTDYESQALAVYEEAIALSVAGTCQAEARFLTTLEAKALLRFVAERMQRPELTDEEMVPTDQG